MRGPRGIGLLSVRPRGQSCRWSMRAVPLPGDPQPVAQEATLCHMNIQRNMPPMDTVIFGQLLNES